MKASRVTELPNGYKVETWWDPSSRNYITQLFNYDGFDVETSFGRSIYSGNKSDAQVAHQWIVEESDKAVAEYETVYQGNL